MFNVIKLITLFKFATQLAAFLVHIWFFHLGAVAVAVAIVRPFHLTLNARVLSVSFHVLFHTAPWYCVCHDLVLVHCSLSSDNSNKHFNQRPDPNQCNGRYRCYHRRTAFTIIFNFTRLLCARQNRLLHCTQFLCSRFIFIWKRPAILLRIHSHSQWSDGVITHTALKLSNSLYIT